MKIVSFSDTHNLHEKVVLPECDIAIFAGDYSGRGNRLETYHFLKWFSLQEQCKYKVMIAGNHDICFDDKFIEETHSHTWLKDLLIKYNNISILEEESINIKGVNIWGSPVSPWYEGHRWAFNKKRNVIHNIWDEIPANTDILITHGPAYKILDKIYDGRNVGCESLLKKIKEIKPMYHICGHIHEAYGSEKIGNTTHINCSLVNEIYEIGNLPIEFEI